MRVTPPSGGWVLALLLASGTAAAAAVRPLRPVESAVPQPAPAAPVSSAPPSGSGALREVPAAPSSAAGAPEDGPGARDGIAEARARLRSYADDSPAAEVDRWALRLAVADREATASALLRFRYYEPLIRRALADHGVPADLAFLAFVESGYRPGATSRKGAAGMWQFMGPTGRAYGLEVSAYVDERRDPIRSTYAAARHLRDLFRELGSWHLAAAAYNGGSDRVRRALRGDRAREDGAFWRSRSRLPAETRHYVPRVLAAARVGRDPALYGIAVPDSVPPLRFREVRVPGGVPLADVARRYSASERAVLALNPHLTRAMTPPGRSWPVRLPVGS